MTRLTCSATRRTYLEETFAATTVASAIAEFRARHGMLPERVNDRQLLGLCESCGKPVFIGDRYGADAVSTGEATRYCCAACMRRIDR